ncbi:tail-specific protease [Fulvivirga imtechensis AK7]|uniref:Tail-specific protease n=1 Tax=Fulvivirga imtechensis AK7 TaxID=1237149 RepID=L8JKU7_9BACT|nr:S41 family peptidase [Fulvivirga imtechensis]ELR69556.1 tail-specific protease [Fulvivirga imtechensis AK7]
MLKKRTNKLVALFFIIGITLVSFTAPTERYFEIAKNLDIFATLFKEVNAYYVDEVDPDKVIRTGIDAMLLSLDPYTNYIPEDEIESFRTMTTGQYAGIGALISVVNGKTVITMPYQGFAAYNAGLKIGDELIAIDGKKVVGMEVSDISTLLKGQAKTPVEVTIKRYGHEEPLSFSFKRERITVTNVPYFGKVNDNIGYIKLEDFTMDAGKEVARAVEELKKQGADKIILDLRNNPGGLLSEAVNVSNVFVPKGVDVVSTRGKVTEWNKTYKTLNNPVDNKIPLVVLTNGGSASAAEIVSGVMQDYDRGLLVGSRTFGKGLVQTTRPLTYNAQLKVTTAKYYIPSGRCIQSLDYTHRNEDGTVSKVADSLISEFKTKNGRTVYDGGGLDPDVDIEQEYYTPITQSLLTKGLIFEYATQYSSKRKSIPSAAEFELTDEEYKQFKSWLSDKDYDYTTQVEEELVELEESAKKEKYYKDIANQLMDLKNKVKHNKEQDLEKFKSEIKQVLKEEIASRYYLQKGSLEASFNDDRDIQKAIELLKDTATYNQLLSGK